MSQNRACIYTDCIPLFESKFKIKLYEPLHCEHTELYEPLQAVK